MKVWAGFGSEHSMNLVMIGRFREPAQAEEARRLIEKLVEQARDEPDVDRDRGPEHKRFSDALMKILSAAELHILSPDEIDQFRYDASLSVEGERLVIRTDEVDVSGFLKVMLDRGAKVEVFSAHDHPEPSNRQQPQ